MQIYQSFEVRFVKASQTPLYKERRSNLKEQKSTIKVVKDSLANKASSHVFLTGYES